MPFLYAVAAIATGVPVLYALGMAVWGAGINPTEYLSLLGSLLPAAAALVGLFNKRLSSGLALLGAIGICPFYFMVIFFIVTVRLSDQELTLTVMRWSPSPSPLTIHEFTEGSGYPETKLSQRDIQEIRETGIAGSVKTFTANGKYGMGKKSHVILILQEPVTEAFTLPEPDAANIVYVQYQNQWKHFPPKVRLLKRTIRVEPLFGDPKQTMVHVEYSDGSSRGFGVWWPDPKRLHQ